jgi:hypothetical protein
MWFDNITNNQTADCWNLAWAWDILDEVSHHDALHITRSKEANVL